MDKSSSIKLIKEIQTQDEIGQYITSESIKEVFCNVKSITRTEWFEAGRSGFKPALMFIIFEYDYEGESIVEYQGKRYGVYRTYIARDEQMELYVQEMGGI